MRTLSSRRACASVWLTSAATLVGLAFSPVLASAQTNEEILDKARTAFEEGTEHKDQLLAARRDFGRATDHYLELHRREVRSAALYRELGTAALLADRWPEAIWAYQMGLTLDANDRVLRERLAFARGKVIYPAAGQGQLAAESWPVWLHRPTFTELFLVFASFYTVASLAGAWAYASRKLIPFLIASFFTLGALGFGLGASMVWEKDNHDRAQPLVIIADNTPFYRGNGSSYPQHASVPLLPRGLEACIVHRRGDWLQIRLSTGEVGWLPRSQALIVEP